MSYTVKPFYRDADGQEYPWTEPFPLPTEDLDAYKSRAKETVATLKRPSAPPDGPRPDGFRIEDEEGVTVFRYPPEEGGW